MHNKPYPLFLVAFLHCCAFNVISCALVYLFHDRFGFNSGFIGIVFAIGTTCYFCAAQAYRILFGSRRPSSVILPATCILWLLVNVLAFTRVSAVAVLSWGLVNVASGFFYSPLIVWVSGDITDDKELNVTVSWYNRSWMTGSFLAPFVAGWLYQRNPDLPLILARVLIGLEILMVVILVVKGRTARIAPARDKTQSAKTGSPVQRNGPGGESVEVAVHHFAILGRTAALCCNILGGVILNILPLFLRDVRGYSEQNVGAVLMLRGLLSLATFIVFIRFTFWHFNRRWFLVIQAGLIADALLLCLLGSNIVFCALMIAFYGFLYASSYNNSIFYASADKKTAGKSAAYHETFINMGQAIGSLGGGFCFQYLGMPATFLIITGMQAVGAFFLATLYRKH
jgi:predicted MFS family arabinose efflux permease